MKPFKSILTVSLLLIVSALTAQSNQTAASKSNDPKALEILNKASSNYNSGGGVKASFTLQVLAKGGSVRETINGTIQLRSSRFKLITSDMITWFDGSNQWLYVKGNNEVNLSKPTAKDMILYNPVNVYQLYKHGYNCKLMIDKTLNGKKHHQVELKPVKDAVIQNIVVVFDKSSYRPINIVLTNKDKSGSKIAINSYIAGQNYTESSFTFNPKEYPGAEIIDLR